MSVKTFGQALLVSFAISICICHFLPLASAGAPVAKEKKKEAAVTVELPVVYDFWAKWCVPCKVIKPIFEEVEQEYKGKVDMKAIDFDDPSNKALVDKYAVEQLPFLVFVNPKTKKTETFHGKITKKELVDRVQKLLAK